jgi:hypothetical protein
MTMPGAKPVAEQQVVELYPIFDRVSRRREMVNAERYEQERATLGRLLRYLAKTIPADAKEVLEAYPFVEVKDMYQDVTEALTASGKRYATGELAAAGFWAREATEFTGIEVKAHERFLQESMFSYVGKRVGLAVIGFFEGAAEAMVGLIDTGASLFGFHPDLEGKIARRYAEIKDAYSATTGIDHNLTHDAAIGRFGGRLAENLATGKAIGQLGRVGTIINVSQAAAGAKSTVEAVVAMREAGKSWNDILSDPVMLAQFAGSLAGVAGVGGAALPQLRNALSSAGMVLTAGQLTALTTALLTYKDDPTLSDQQNFARRADLLGDVLASAAFLGEDVKTRATTPPGGAGPSVEATVRTKDGEAEVHVHDGSVEVCPVQRCARASTVVEGDDKARDEVKQAEDLARRDPGQAAAKAVAALDASDRGPSKARRREMIAAAAELRHGAAPSRRRRREMIAAAAERRRAATAGGRARARGGKGLEFTPSKHADAGLRKLAKSGGDWSLLTGKESRATGVFIHRVMEGLIAHLRATGSRVAQREAITAAAIKGWQEAGRKVTLVEAHLPKNGRKPRLDLAEIDFANRRIVVVDYVPTSDRAHLEKTLAYANELAAMTGFDASAVDVEYVTAGELAGSLNDSW